MELRICRSSLKTPNYLSFVVGFTKGKVSAFDGMEKIVVNVELALEETVEQQRADSIISSTAPQEHYFQRLLDSASRGVNDPALLTIDEIRTVCSALMI